MWLTHQGRPTPSRRAGRLQNVSDSWSTKWRRNVRYDTFTWTVEWPPFGAAGCALPYRTTFTKYHDAPTAMSPAAGNAGSPRAGAIA